MKGGQYARPLGWVAVLVPLLAGIALRVLVSVGTIPADILYLRADVGTAALLIGLSLSGLATPYLFLWMRFETRRQEQVRALQAHFAEDRRRFLRRLDHELKNPLTAIRAGLANLAGVPSEAARQEALGSVDAQALRLSRLAADLRKLADLETRPLERTQVDLGDLLREVLDVAGEHPDATARRLSLTVPQAPWPLPTVDGDPDLIFLALHNLLSNAIKFTEPGDTVEVRAYEDGTSVVVEVADTGPGIPEQEIPHVWEELYRGQGARGVPGSGLGLALVQAIVDRHGGQATLRSRVGQGTVFAIRLPQQAR